MEQLKIFCSTDETKHQQLSAPFSVEEYTYFTDGHIAIRVPLIDGVGENPFAPDIKKLPFWDHESFDDFGALPEFSDEDATDCIGCGGAGEVFTCPECHGEGEVMAETTHNEYECECATCSGSGKYRNPGSRALKCDDCDGTGKNESTPISFGITGISLRHLKKISTLPEIKVSPSTTDPFEAFRFIFDGGVGIVMPSRMGQ